MHLAAFLLVAIAILAGCGGSTNEPKTAASKAGQGADMSIGDAAVRQGGMFASSETAPPLASSLEAFRVDKKIKFDGLLSEWPARAAATTVVQGAASDLTFQGAVQYDEQNLYIAGETNDSKFMAGKDHASLAIALPGAGGVPIAYEVAFFPGKPGETQGRVLFAFGPKRGEPVPGAKVIEAPLGTGYSFEAVVPWSTFPEARAVRVGLRGVLSYYNANQPSAQASATGGKATILATGPGDVEHVAQLPSLPTEPEQALIAGLLKPRGLAARGPTIDVYADVEGDSLKERISVFDRFLTILGQGYRDGKEFYFRDLGTHFVVRIDARDLTGDGKDDLLVRSRFEQGGAIREWFEVWQIAPSGEPVTLFAHEIAVSRGASRIANSVFIHEKEIEVALEPAAGWTSASYREARTTEVEPILLPWGGVRSRTYRLDQGRFVRKSELGQKPQTAPPSVAPPPSTGTSTTAARPAEAPATPSPLDQFRRDRNLAPDVAPKVDLTVHVAEDPRPERVVLLGNDIVVFGPGFKGGSQYAYLSLVQFASPGSIKELAARDLNGDGAAELIVRGVRVTAPRQGTTAEITSEAIFVYELRGGNIARVFGAETAREQAPNRVQALFQFLPAKSGKAIDIELRPGKASGWTEKTYPWPREAPGPVEPLLLPWGPVPSARYTWNASSLRFEAAK